MSVISTLLALEPHRAYDGMQLRSHFIRSTFGLEGDAAVIFRGPCDVQIEGLVDLEDREAGAFIRSRDMLHLMVELFEADLTRMVLTQRLLTAMVADRIRDSIPAEVAASVRRSGDDVYVGSGKLTVSIATVSAVSGLIHLGVNVDDRDTPVETSALGPLGITPETFAEGLLDDLASELADVRRAVCKVRPAHGE